MRVFTRPDSGRLSRLGHRGVRWAHRGALSAFPGALAPCPSIGSTCRTVPKILDPPVSLPRRQCMRSSFRLAGQEECSPPVTGLLDGAPKSPTPRTPRRTPPFHPEASVDLETSLRKGIGIKAQFGGDRKRFLRIFFGSRLTSGAAEEAGERRERGRGAFRPGFVEPSDPHPDLASPNADLPFPRGGDRDLVSLPESSPCVRRRHSGRTSGSMP